MAFGYYYYSMYGRDVLPTAAAGLPHYDYTWGYEFPSLGQLCRRKHYCYWYLSNLESQSMSYCYYCSFPKCFQWLEIYLNNVCYYYCYCSRQFSSYRKNYHLKREKETCDEWGWKRKKHFSTRKIFCVREGEQVEGKWKVLFLYLTCFNYDGNNRLFKRKEKVCLKSPGKWKRNEKTAFNFEIAVWH